MVETRNTVNCLLQDSQNLSTPARATASAVDSLTPARRRLQHCSGHTHYLTTQHNQTLVSQEYNKLRPGSSLTKLDLPCCSSQSLVAIDGYLNIQYLEYMELIQLGR